VTDNRFAVSLSADGQTVYAKLDNVAATATWTGAGDGVSLAGKTDLSAIRKSESPYVVTWLSQPANVEFVLDARSKADGYRISPEAGGLRLNRTMAFMILVK
jgi:hypothetical protein